MRAAAEIGLSPSTLSHAMRRLEKRLGVRLLARTTRSVAPTAAGERLLASVQPALDEVTRGLSAPPTGATRPPAPLATFRYAAREILVPKLPGFLVEHPDIAIEVVTDDRLIDLVAIGFDAGIRLGESVEHDGTRGRR